MTHPFFVDTILILQIGGKKMLKLKIEEYLMNQTEFFSFNSPSTNFTAGHISEIFEVRRNTVSHYLNELVAENKVIKIKSRPVYFLHKGIFESAFFPVSSMEFSNLEDLKNNENFSEEKRDIFSIAIGFEGSLKEPIEKIKTAAHYPLLGLPCIVLGTTGSGKSFLAKLMHQYSIDNSIIEVDAPFVSFNCAQYADNPELLTSNLFGYKKDSFTGANKDKDGAFVEADGGYLFLDEVHRLSPEGQEKLFTYLDQHKIYPLGETGEGKEVSVRLIFATTESLESNFLKTFLRRIPIQITLPNLNQRNTYELKELIIHFFIEEAKQIRRTILVTRSVYELLLNFEYSGNVGELEGVIKYAVATAYSKNLLLRKIRLSVAELPQNLVKNSKSIKYNLHSEDIEIEIDPNKSLISYSDFFYRKENNLTIFFDSIVTTCNDFFEEKIDQSTSEEMIVKKIENFFDVLIFSDSSLGNIPFYNYIFSGVREVLDYFEEKNRIRFNGDSLYAISYYLFYKHSIEIFSKSKAEKSIDKFIMYLRNEKAEIYKFADSILSVLERKTDVPVNHFDQIVFTLYLDRMVQKKTSNYARAIIVAHGYSTASSIANVVNRLLDMPIFEAFDMPIDSTVADIFSEINNYLSDVDTNDGIVILFDMGSLEKLADLIYNRLTSPVILMNNVSTQLALFVGEQIQQHADFKSIIETIKKNNKDHYQLILPMKKNKKAIITTCMTGIGTAIKIQNLLEKCFAPISSIENYEIVPCDFHSLRESGKNNYVFENYDVQAIIGTEDPNIEQLIYISLNEMMSGKGVYTLNKIFAHSLSEEDLEKMNEEIVQNFSIERVIESVTILDSKTALKNVSTGIKNYEIVSQKRLTNSKKMYLNVHICCLIERLIRNTPITSYLVDEQNEKITPQLLSNIKVSLASIEEIYNISIPAIELNYIADIITAEEDLQNTEEF